MSKDRTKEPASTSRQRGMAEAVQQKRGDTLGLKAFEKISAVEGVRLSEEMRRDIERASDAKLGPAERARFVMDKYGKT